MAATATTRNRRLMTCDHWQSFVSNFVLVYFIVSLYTGCPFWELEMRDWFNWGKVAQSRTYFNAHWKWKKNPHLIVLQNCIRHIVHMKYQIIKWHTVGFSSRCWMCIKSSMFDYLGYDARSRSTDNAEFAWPAIQSSTAWRAPRQEQLQPHWFRSFRAQCPILRHQIVLGRWHSSQHQGMLIGLVRAECVYRFRRIFSTTFGAAPSTGTSVWIWPIANAKAMVVCICSFRWTVPDIFAEWPKWSQPSITIPIVRCGRRTSGRASLRLALYFALIQFFPPVRVAF